MRAAASLTRVPDAPQIIHFDGRDIVLCGTPLTIKGQLSGKLYLSQDITADHQKYQAGLWGLFWLSILVLLSLIVLISQRIRQAMLPLTRMSQIASAVSADDLNGAKLQLEQAPDEILGLATAFNQMLWRLSGAWEQQRQFVGNVSHELRTPLTVVIGYLQSLQRRSTNLNPYQQQALETATSETERIIRMLQDLLDLARADSGHLHFRSHPIILNTLLTEVAAMSQKVSDRKMTLLLTNEDVVICGDQDRLQQVLINLLDNAIKFTSQGEIILGVSLDGRLLCYYLLFVLAVGMLLSLLRIVNSPFGRVLQAIRENEFRAEAIGYRVVVYRTLSSVLSALYACVAGAMLALWLRYNGPDTSLSFEIMMDVLLIVVIGGMGTIYGAAIGAVLFLLAQSYLQDLLRLASEATTSLPMLSALLSPDRWLLWLGLLFVLSVYYFPTGVVGRLRTRAALKRSSKKPGLEEAL
jgi:signal transduction histidine kinase